VVEQPVCHDGFQSLHKKNASQQYVLQLAAGPTADDPGRFAAKLLATMLGDDSGSRLYWELVDPGLAEQAGVSHFEYQGAGGFMSFMSCDPEHAVDNLQRMIDTFRCAQADGFTAGELEQAASKLRSRIVLAGERPRGRLFAVGNDWIHRGEYRSVADDLASVAAVTLDEVGDVLARFPLTRNTTVAIGPLKKLKPPK
jgi:predicted Zn-dependent peptidase